MNKIIHKIGLSILIIGLINMFNIFKYGGTISIPEELGALRIDETTIKIITTIVIITYVIFSVQHIDKEEGKYRKIETDVIIGLSIIGGIIMILSKELIILYIGLELYSFTIYILILTKENYKLRRIGIIYLIISSLSNAILIYGFSRIYKEFGTLDINRLMELSKILDGQEMIGITLIIITLIFKLGLVPFSNWVIRIYSEVDTRILWYQLIIPKIIFLTITLKLIEYINIDIIKYTLYVVSIASIIIGTIGGLNQKKDKTILAYSSILNIGYIILTLSLIMIANTSINAEQIWVIIQYIIIYVINILGLMTIMIINNRNKNIFKNKYKKYYYISLITMIFSLIGLPPFSGFFSKFYILFSLYNTTILTIITITIFILFSLLSSILYLKIILYSSVLNKDLKEDLIVDSQPNHTSFTSSEGNSTLIISLSTIITILYPLFISNMIPFYYLSI